MAYSAVASLLQSLDHLIKCSLVILEVKISETRQFTWTMDDVEAMFLTFLELSEENQCLLTDVKENQVGKIRRALEFLVTGLTLSPAAYQSTVEELASKCQFDDFHRMLLLRAHDPMKNLFRMIERLNFPQKAVTETILDRQKLKENASFIFGVYQLTSVLREELCFLLTYLDHSLNMNLPEGMLKCIKQVSDSVKHLIEDAILRSAIHKVGNLAVARGFEALFKLKTFCVSGIEKKVKMVFDGSEGIRGNLAQAVEQLICIKAEITCEKRSVDDKVPSSKSCGISSRDPKEDIVVDFVDEELVLERLISNAAQPGLETISIVGMGGVGKTTLAKKLFHHPCTLFHFDCCAWVTVSQVYVVRDLLLALVNSFAPKFDKMSEKSNAKLCEYLYRSLKCKRYLIVVDDMWSIAAWNDIKRCFPDDKTGSRIIITCRFIELAHLVSLKPPHFMNLFDAEKSWELFQKLVCRNALCSSELEEVGRQIAKRCCGLPLAIVVIAGVLCSTPMTLESWTYIADNLNTIVAIDREQCLDILALSYVYMPYRLRACFLYMGAFPEDCEIDVQKLINLWMAEGFFYSRCHEHLEQVAREYLEELISRNLVMVEKRSFGGRVKTCRLHDFVREFCLIESRKENFMSVARRGNSENLFSSLRNQQRLSFHLDPYCSVPTTLALPQVLSFLCFSLGSTIVPDILFFQLEFKLLRALDVYFLRFEYFPEQILRLVHLRYLALNVTFQLPDCVSLLTNLQTFVLQGPWVSPRFDSCSKFYMKCWILPLLRHLKTSVAIELMEPLIEHGDGLKYMQSLSIIRFSSCRTSVCKIMPSLKRLHIFETEDDYNNDRSCFFLNNLVYLQELFTLKCCFYMRNQELRRLSCLDAFPKSLRQLTLSWSYLPWEEMTTISRLPNLQVLKLKNYAFQGQKWVVAEEGFLNLKGLLIDNADLVVLDATVHQFPRLQNLTLKLCRHLEEIPFGIDETGSLQRMEVHYCSNRIEVLAKELQDQDEGIDVVVRTNLSQHNI